MAKSDEAGEEDAPDLDKFQWGEGDVTIEPGESTVQDRAAWAETERRKKVLEALGGKA